MKFLIGIPALLFTLTLNAQSLTISGILRDGRTNETLSGVSILIFRPGDFSGAVSSPEGKFSLHLMGKVDSVKFSAIGFRSLVLSGDNLVRSGDLKLVLDPVAEDLAAVVIRPVSAMEIIQKAIEKLKLSLPVTNYEVKAFYRETIQDTQFYYSVAEAIFKAQFFPQKNTAKLALIKGRTKEDISYSRLFEDFHPGGGPEGVVGLSFSRQLPDFLNADKIKYFVYEKAHTVSFEGHPVYTILFDQKPGVKEALEAGKIFIDAEDYSILKFEARNSIAGSPYIKSLKGTDKLFAELLHIDFNLKGWSTTASFNKIGGHVYLNYAGLNYFINYKQPKKDLNLDLSIQTELMVTDFQDGVKEELDKKDEWKRKNLVANLPADFDPAFWGTNNVMSPTKKITEMIEAISARNNDPDTTHLSDGWEYLHRDYFFASGKGDSLNLVCLKKCNWEDDETGGMISQKLNGNFNIEAKLAVIKRSNRLAAPENGFQQAGIILRCGDGRSENSLILSLGTGGNEKPKYFIKRTLNGKTKISVEKTDSLTAWLRIQRQNDHIYAFMRSDEKKSWSRIADYESGWLKDPVQAGFSIMARFAGDGPKQHPDIKAIFSNIKIGEIH